MKKTLSIFLLSFLAIAVNGQIKRVPISETTIGTVNCLYQKSINLDKGDTTTYFYLGFQNKKYSSIIDIKGIMLDLTKDSANIYDFLKDLKAASLEMGNKTSISWDRKRYSLYLYDFNQDLYFAEEKSRGDGYTTLSKKQVEKLISWFESIGFKKA